MSVDIRIKKLDKLTVDIERLRQGSSVRWPKEILDTAGEMMKDSIVDEAPGRTGELKDSVRVETTKDTRTVIVGAPHGRFVNDGTGPSPGRYVPAIGRRLVRGTNIGMHPGTRATHFFDNGVRFAIPRILGYVHRKVYEYLMR